MGQDQLWFEEFRKSKEYELLKKRPIAYFCAEFGLLNNSPTYAGGLGILAADILREAADQQIPMVALGMYYEEGYLHHEMQKDGILLKHPLPKSAENYGFSLVMDNNQQPIIIDIPLEGRLLKVRAFELRLKTARLFLLDTDVAENDQADRKINDRLYITNKEVRFKQQIVLGIAGLRLLEALQIHPAIYHLNEGHSALLAFEVAHHEMNEYKKAFFAELKRAGEHIVFSNHTLLAAGNDTFNNDLVSVLLSDYAKELRVPVSELVALGLVKDSSIFSMTLLALRMSSLSNAVSKIHAQKAAEIWPDHPMMAITNGVHIGTWDKLGPKFQRSKDTKSQSSVNSETVQLWNSSTLLWQKHQENKRELLKYIQEKTGNIWDGNHLLVGWARRMVPYKRPLAIFQDKEHLLRLVHDIYRPLRIVIAGSAHESDKEGAQILEEIRLLLTSELGQFVTYLPDYNINLARKLIPGCDVWLNTPVVGFEACGTSGMKGCLNGVLPCSTKDGWMAEVETYGIGWSLENDNISESLLKTLEHQIIPMYYYRDRNGIPGAWIENMKNARELILNEYTTTRMLHDYINKLYLPVMNTLQNSHV